MNLILIVLLLACSAVYFHRSSYLGELAISFAPYRALLALIGLLICGWRLFIVFTKKQKIWIKISFFLLIAFSGVSFLFLKEIASFYGEYSLSPSEKSGVTVLFSNIYKDNQDYASLIQALASHNPDLAMFVEFQEHHYDALSPYLYQHYPYIKYLPWSTSIIASKYPIRMLPNLVSKRVWRYHTFELQKEDQTFYGYLVHTSSPTSLQHFRNRNQQLTILAEDVLLLQQTPSAEKIFMVWDFNVSPRSQYYQTFAQSLSGKMENATRAFPFYFSWNLAKLIEISGIQSWLPELLFSHIDQLFLSPATKIKSLEGIQLSGSDHKGFLFELY